MKLKRQSTVLRSFEEMEIYGMRRKEKREIG